MTTFKDNGEAIDEIVSRIKKHASDRDASAQATVQSEQSRLDAERELIEAYDRQRAAYEAVMQFIAALAPLTPLVTNTAAALAEKTAKEEEKRRLKAEAEAKAEADRQAAAAAAAAAEAARLAAEEAAAEAQRQADEVARLEAERRQAADAEAARLAAEVPAAAEVPTSPPAAPEPAVPEPAVPETVSAVVDFVRPVDNG